MKSEREELAKEIQWDMSNYVNLEDPKNDDFIEADISKILAREKALQDRIRVLEGKLEDNFRYGCKGINDAMREGGY